MAQKKEYLSKNQKIVLDIIEKSAQPMKAYSILFNVQKKGLKAPPQVYRALDKLVEIGNGKYMIADGSFIIEFQGNTDRQKFNEEYSIIPKYEMGTRTAYQPLEFENLDGVLKRLNADNRVISFELDLIDPNVVLQ